MAKANPRSTPFSRRTVLRGSATSIVALAAVVPALVPQAALAAGAPDPLIALFDRFTEAEQLYKVQSKRSATIWKALPETARGGWPRIDRSLPIFRDFPPVSEGFDAICDRPNLQEIRAYNTNVEIDADGDPAALAKVREDGRARVRWWIAARRDCERIRAESGADEADEMLIEYGNVMDEAAQAVLNGEPTTLAGALIKLRVVVYLVKQDHSVNEGEALEELSWQEEGTISVLADFERLAGRAQT